MDARGSLPSLLTLNSNYGPLWSCQTRCCLFQSQTYPSHWGYNVQHSLNGEPVATQVLHSVYVIVAEETQADLAEGTGRHHLCHSHLWEEQTASPERLAYLFFL